MAAVTTSFRAPYDRVVLAVPVTIPYVRYSIESAQWWIGARAEVAGRGCRDRAARHRRVLRLQLHHGHRQRHRPDPAFRAVRALARPIPLGGASAIAALRRAARAVQAGDADIVACVAGDTNHVDSFRNTLENFSRFDQDAVYPYGAGGAECELRADRAQLHARPSARRREDFGRIAVSQRANALRNPHALMKTPLTIEQYMAARLIADPIHLFDCVMPCAGAEAFLVMREEDARRSSFLPPSILATIERHNAFPRRSDPGPRRLGDGYRRALRDGRRAAGRSSISSRPMTTIPSSR